MATPAQPVVDRIQQSTTYNANGQLVVAYIVTFHVGADGPFTLQVNGADFSAATVKQRMDAVANELGQIPRAGQ